MSVTEREGTKQHRTEITSRNDSKLSLAVLCRARILGEAKPGVERKCRGFVVLAVVAVLSGIV